MIETVPPAEISQRISKFQATLAASELEGAFILQNADRFYFTGTIQSAILFVPSNGDPILMVQKNLKRAQLESSLKNIIYEIEQIKKAAAILHTGLTEIKGLKRLTQTRQALIQI